MAKLTTIVGFVTVMGIKTAGAAEPTASWWAESLPEGAPFVELPGMQSVLVGRVSVPNFLTGLSENESLYPRNITVGISVINTPSFELGLQSGHRLGRDTHDEAVLQGLDTVDDSLEFGFFTHGRYGEYLVGTWVSKDVSQGHEGTLGEFMAGYEKRLSDKLGLSLGVTTAWADEKFMESFYGIDSTHAVNSGVQSYQPGAGFKNASLRFTACYQLNDLWSFGAQLGYRRLLQDVAHSPAVDNDRIEEFVGGLQFQYNLSAFSAPTPRNVLASPCSPF